MELSQVKGLWGWRSAIEDLASGGEVFEGTRRIRAGGLFEHGKVRSEKIRKAGIPVIVLR